MIGLLLILFSLVADVRTDVRTAESVAQLELQGAEEMAILCNTRRDRVLTLFRAGAATETRYHEVQRRVLDANLNKERCRRTLALLMGGKEPLVTPTRLDLLLKTEKLEAARLARVRTAHEASLVSSDEVERAVLRHQLAWIERNHASRLKMEGADPKALAIRRNQDRAKVRLRTAEKLVAIYKKTKPGSDALFAANVERIQASLASKVAGLSDLPR